MEKYMIKFQRKMNLMRFLMVVAIDLLVHYRQRNKLQIIYDNKYSLRRNKT